MSGRNRIVVGDVEFEPGENREQLGLGSLAGDAEEFYVLQFNGPIQQEWLRQLQKIGVAPGDYVPENAFVVALAFHSIYQLRKLRELEFVRSINPYLAEFKISSRLKGRRGTISLSEHRSLRIVPETAPFNERGNLTVVLHNPTFTSAVSQIVAQLGGKIVVGESDFIRLAADIASVVDRLAEVRGVKWIEPYREPSFSLDVASGIVNASRLANERDLDGTGQIAAVADTGLDRGKDDEELHPDFQGRIVSIHALGRPPNDASDPNGHGTHVAGTVLGDGARSGGVVKGVTPGARLVFQSVMDANGGLGGLPANLNTLFLQAFNDGARTHNNSWGADVDGQYTLESRQVDQFVWEHRDMVIMFAAGNAGKDKNKDGIIDRDSIGSPATAKNCITVGATENAKPGLTVTRRDAFGQLPANDLRNQGEGGKGPLGNQHRGRMFYTGSDRERLVRRLQGMLNELEVADDEGNPLELDGDFGDRTEQAVGRFQAANVDSDGIPLKVDGLVGPKTSGALNKEFDDRSIPITYSLFRFISDPIRRDHIADDSEGMAAFSSRGPTDDGRIRPDIVAPGTSILATKSRLANDSRRHGTSTNPDYMFLSGTSMATPMVTGSATLVRQRLGQVMAEAGIEEFRWRKRIADLSPSAALVKGLLIHGAAQVPGQYANPQNDSGGDVPNTVQGFGRVDLEESLFPPSPTIVELFDGHRVSTGERREYQFRVEDPSVPVKASLVWTDSPGSRLVNDLTLIVVTPDGEEHHGNSIGPQPPGQSLDHTNNVEKIQVPSPSQGTYKVIVSGDNVPQAAPGGPGEDYALVVSGNLVSILKAVKRRGEPPEAFPANPGPLPASKLCNRAPPFNPIQGDGPLQRGDGRGPMVKHLQQMLTDLGLYSGDVDGAFGNQTVKAVKEFQRTNKDWDGIDLEVDELVGPRTSDALNRAMTGIWYDRYETPRELTADRILLTATATALENRISFDPEGVESAKVIRAGEPGGAVLKLLDPSGDRFAFEGEARFEVLDEDEKVLKKGKITPDQDITISPTMVPDSVELEVSKTFRTFYVEEE